MTPAQRDQAVRDVARYLRLNTTPSDEDGDDLLDEACDIVNLVARDLAA